MQTIPSLEKIIQALKKELPERKKSLENPKTDLGIRKLRKELKRNQRKRRILLSQVPAPKKDKEEKKAAGPEKKEA